MIKQIKSVNEVKVGMKMFVFYQGRFEECFTLFSEPVWNVDIGCYFAQKKCWSQCFKEYMGTSFSLQDCGIEPNTYNDRKTFSYDNDCELESIRTLTLSELQDYITSQQCCRLLCCPFRKPIKKFKTVKKEFLG
jgi:hypothetical protein